VFREAWHVIANRPGKDFPVPVAPDRLQKIAGPVAFGLSIQPNHYIPLGSHSSLEPEQIGTMPRVKGYRQRNGGKDSQSSRNNQQLCQFDPAKAPCRGHNSIGHNNAGPKPQDGITRLGKIGNSGYKQCRDDRPIPSRGRYFGIES